MSTRPSLTCLEHKFGNRRPSQQIPRHGARSCPEWTNIRLTTNKAGYLLRKLQFELRSADVQEDLPAMTVLSGFLWHIPTSRESYSPYLVK